MMSKAIGALKAVWRRLTSSKVAWMALPMGVAQVWLAVSGQDVSKEVDIIFSAVWTMLGVFLATNNPTDKENF